LDAENLRPHYGKTLWHWVTRLEQHADEARRLIGEQKYRIWRIYRLVPPMPLIAAGWNCSRCWWAKALTVAS
jgi:hypothetical protein